jgi:hypothetical protein
METERHKGGVVVISGTKQEIATETARIVSGIKDKLREQFDSGEFSAIEEFLDRGFGPNAFLAIASIFLYAQKSGKTVDEVIAKINEEWKRNWSYQHPDIRGDPAAPGGAGKQNRLSLINIYRALGIPLPEEAKKSEIPDGPFVVKTRNSTYRFGKKEDDGTRSVSKDGYKLPHNRCKISRLTRGEEMELDWPDDPDHYLHSTVVLSIEPE